MLSLAYCDGCRIGQPVLREVFDAVEADPIDRAHELLRGPEELFVTDRKAPTKEVGYYLVKRESWAGILL
jgi:hypothetical protein